jgi:uncharacterized protein YueI
MSATLKVESFFYRSGIGSFQERIVVALNRAKNQKFTDKPMKCLAELPVVKHTIVMRSVQQYVNHYMRNSPEIHVSFVIEKLLQKRLKLRLGGGHLVAETFEENIELSIAENLVQFLARIVFGRVA